MAGSIALDEDTALTLVPAMMTRCELAAVRRLPGSVVLELSSVLPSWIPRSSASSLAVILSPRAVRVHFATQPTNLRQSLEGLTDQTATLLGIDRFSGTCSCPQRLARGSRSSW